MRTVAEILSEIKGRDLLVANCYQLMTHPAHPNSPSLPTGEWQANLRNIRGWYDYGRGTSIEAALEDALERAKGLQGPENRPIPKTPSPEKAASIEDLL